MTGTSSISDGFGLDQGFATTLSALLAACRVAGFEFRISQGLRTPQKQAEYYCRWARRTPAMVDAAVESLRDAGAVWLASVLRAYRDIPRQPNWLTNALPGAGWHQWGLAADCYCYRNGKIVEDGDDPCYKFYADEAVRLGLTAGYYFARQDSGHVQATAAAGATSVYTWPYIDAVMKERFADKHVVALTKFVSDAVASESPAYSLIANRSATAVSAHYKDDPALQVVRLKPSRIYKLSSAKGPVLAIARTYNAVGGLIDAPSSTLSIDPVAMLAVWYVESGGRVFETGRPVLRFENHKFFKYWGRANTATFDKHFQFGGRAGVPGASSKNHKFRRSASDNWQAVHVDDQRREYDAFALAEDLGGKEAACLSSSFGGPQIMGFNHQACGYSSASALADAFAVDERWHVLGFADFCESNSLIDEIQDKAWKRFGARYNGDGEVYGPKLKAAFDLKPKLLALPTEVAP
jgi:hypothetical protein